MPSYKDVSSSDSDDYHEVDSSFNQTLEPEGIEDEKRLVKNKPVGRKLAEVTKELAGCKLNGSAIEYEDSDEEEVVEGLIVGQPEKELEMAGENDNQNNQNQDPVDFEDQNEPDGAKAIEYSRTLVMEFNPQEVEFWFIQLENEMFTCQVKSQWMKRCILVKNLPPKIQADVKSLLVIKQSQAPADLYKKIKNEILRIHAPRREDTFKKALSRVLVGLPSQLGQTLINDVCHNQGQKLEGCCCAHIIYTLWTLQLPLSVRSHVASMTFNATTYREVFESADKVFLSTKSTEVSANVAAISKPAGAAAAAEEVGQVAAFKPGKPGKNQRSKPKNNDKSDKSGSNGGGGGNKQNKNVPSNCCRNHKKWAGEAWYCLEPLSCPWVNKIVKKPVTEEK